MLKISSVLCNDLETVQKYLISNRWYSLSYKHDIIYCAMVRSLSRLKHMIQLIENFYFLLASKFDSVKNHVLTKIKIRDISYKKLYAKTCVVAVVHP